MRDNRKDKLEKQAYLNSTNDSKVLQLNAMQQLSGGGGVKCSSLLTSLSLQRSRWCQQAGSTLPTQELSQWVSQRALCLLPSDALIKKTSAWVRETLMLGNGNNLQEKGAQRISNNREGKKGHLFFGFLKVWRVKKMRRMSKKMSPHCEKWRTALCAMSVRRQTLASAHSPVGFLITRMQQSKIRL